VRLRSVFCDARHHLIASASHCARCRAPIRRIAVHFIVICIWRLHRHVACSPPF
jgi:hypothetical protein